jgi:protein-S-isoprenylcysteine O-methyltransferase Ste14
MRTIRFWVVLAVVFADGVLVLFGRVAWNHYWLFAVLCWAVLNVYWALAARKTKPVSGSRIAWLFSLMEFLVYCLPLSSVPILGWRWAPRFAPVEILGAAMCASGAGFAIWSRHVLAESWNNTITLREGHALVTRGPYAMVRHPIYFGFMLLTVGLILVLPEVRALVLLTDIIVFFRRMAPEERNLRATYPKEYAEYERNVKRLLPCIW